MIEDEGQYLQSVYPPNREVGGKGAFCLDDRAFLTEQSSLVIQARKKLMWDNHFMKIQTASLLLTTFLICCPDTLVMADDAEASHPEYSVVTQGTRELLRADGSDFVKILVDASNLGGNEVEIAEITFAPNYVGGGHPHGSMEIFYVLSGELTHVVNGKGATLEPGMVGIVRAGDTVEHINNADVPVKTLVIWIPGGEIERSLGGAQMQPIEPLVIEDMAR